MKCCEHKLITGVGIHRRFIGVIRNVGRGYGMRERCMYTGREVKGGQED